jgi:hypothetical protein
LDHEGTYDLEIPNSIGLIHDPSFEPFVKRRLEKIGQYWNQLTAFYFEYDAPATNNAIENFYSTSLKTHRKKQLLVPGINEQMKLSAMKRAGLLMGPREHLTGCLQMFIPFNGL